MDLAQITHESSYVIKAKQTNKQTTFTVDDFVYKRFFPIFFFFILAYYTSKILLDVK